MIVRCIRCDTEFNSAHEHTHVCPHCHFVFKKDDPDHGSLKIVRSSDLINLKKDHSLLEEAEDKCAFHSDADALDYCKRCDRPICYACIVETQEGRLCESCAEQTGTADPTATADSVPLDRPPPAEEQPRDERMPQQPMPGRPYVAWEHRRRVGRLNALFTTWQQTLLSPRKFFHMVPLTGGYRSPLLYGLFWTLVGMAGGVAWKVLLSIYPTAMVFLEGKPLTLSIQLSPDYALVTALLLLSPLLALVLLLLACWLYHVFVVMLTRQHAGFEATLRVICYSTGVNAFYFLPILGGLIGGLWHLILVTIGLKEVHRFSFPLAICVVLVPYTALFVIGISYMLWAVTGARFDIENLSLDTLFSLLR